MTNLATDATEKDCPDAAVLWQEFRAKLHAFLRRRLPRVEDVEDVLQEVFLKIHRERCQLTEGELVEAWIYRIARHAVADFYRARTRRPGDQPSSEDVDVLLADWPEEASGDVHEVVLGWLEPMVEALPDKYRDALRWADFDGLTQQEVAERLGLSLSGAKSRVQRARNQLGELISDCCILEFGGDGRVVGYESARCGPSPRAGGATSCDAKADGKSQCADG